MPSPVILATGVASSVGFILNGLILYLVLANARRWFHYLFAGILLSCLIWDLGILLTMVRNHQPAELPLYGYIATFPGIFIPALVHHFSVAYSERKASWSVYLAWGATAAVLVLSALGLYGRIEGVIEYSWGNIFALAPSGIVIPLIFVLWLGLMLGSVWVLYLGRKTVSAPLGRRHYGYIMAGFLAMTAAVVKVMIILGVDLPWVLPLGMILNDAFAALIGVAIVKEQLLDITVIIKRSALYSALAALLIFIFSLSEHMLVSYLSELIGGHSQLMHFVSLAIALAVLMPVKNRLEHLINRTFAGRRLEL